jgi:hypothetical protein
MVHAIILTGANGETRLLHHKCRFPYLEADYSTPAAAQEHAQRLREMADFFVHSGGVGAAEVYFNEHELIYA